MFIKQNKKNFEIFFLAYKFKGGGGEPSFSSMGELGGAMEPQGSRQNTVITFRVL